MRVRLVKKQNYSVLDSVFGMLILEKCTQIHITQPKLNSDIVCFCLLFDNICPITIYRRKGIVKSTIYGTHALSLALV